MQIKETGVNFTLSLDDIAQYIEKFGKKGKAEIEALNTLIPGIMANVMSSPGKGIFAEDCERCMALMKKSYMDEANFTIIERAELKYLKTRLDRISDRLNTFHEREKEIMEKVHG